MNTMDNLPTLPSTMRPGDACMWAALTLLRTAEGRGWPRQKMRAFLMELAIQFGGADVTDAQLLEDLKTAVATVRLSRMEAAAKQ